MHSQTSAEFFERLLDEDEAEVETSLEETSVVKKVDRRITMPGSSTRRRKSIEDMQADEQEPEASTIKGIALSPLSFMDEFELINGVPAFVMEVKNQEIPVEEAYPGMDDDPWLRRHFTCHAFSKKGTRLAVGDAAGMIRIWETDNFTLIATRELQSCESVGCVRFLYGEDNLLSASDIYGNCEHISLESELSFRWTLQSIAEIRERCFIDNDDLAIEVAMDPESSSAMLWPPCASEDGTVIVQPISTRIGPQSFICDVRVFISKTSHRNLESTVVVAKGRSLVSQCCLTDDGSSLMVVFVVPQAHETEYIGCKTEECVEVWPNIDYHQRNLPSCHLSCRMGRWSNGGVYAIGWSSGSESTGAGAIKIWKTDTFMTHIKKGKTTPPPIHECQMEDDDTIFHVEMVSPSKENPNEDMVIAICFTESVDDCISINLWDAKKNVFTLRLDTRTPFKETLMGLRQSENRPDVMAFYWGHNNQIMEESLLKMSVSPCKKWIAFYASECDRGYLWSLEDGIPVAKLGLPPMLVDDDQNAVRALKTVTFNPSGKHFVLVGKNRLIAFVPAFLQRQRGLQMNHIYTPQDRYVMYDSLSLAHNGSMAILSGEEKPSNVSAFSTRFGPAFCQITERESHKRRGRRQARNLTWTTMLPKNFCLNRDGSLVGIIYVDNRVAVANVSSATWDPNLELSRFYDEQGQKILSTSKEDIFNRIFFVSVSASTEQVVCFSLQRKGCICWYEVRDELHPLVDRLPLSVDQPLGLKVSQKNRTAVVLGTQSAQIIDLETKEFRETVYYNLSIPKAQQMMAAKSSDNAQIFFTEEDQYQVSADGKNVLMGWDVKNDKPVMLTSGTRSSHLKRTIAMATEGINTNVWLSEDARWVIYASEKGSGADVQKGISINDCHGRRGRRFIPDNLDKTGCVPLFDISGDGRIIVSRSVFPRSKEATTLYDVLFVLTPYGIDGSLPDFERLEMAKKTTTPETVKRLVHDFSWPILNYPDSGDKTLFQHALENRMTNWVENFYDLGKEHDIPINLVWKERNDKNEIVENDVLKWAIETRQHELVWDQLNRLVNHATTARATASIIRRSFRDLFVFFPVIFMRLMESKMLISRFGVAPVAISVIEKNKFLVGTNSNDVDWERKSPEKVKKLWVAMGENLETTERSKKKATIGAESKFVMIENVAQIGTKGIMRILLMLDAPADIYKTNIMKWTIMLKWKTFAYRHCVRDLLGYLIFLATFTVYAVLLATRNHLDGDLMGYLTLIPLVLCVLYGLSSLLGELTQLRRYQIDSYKEFGERRTGRVHYARSQWNWFETISYLIMMPLPIIHLLCCHPWTADDEFEENWGAGFFNRLLSGLVAVEALLLWFKILYYAQAFRQSGSLVIAVREVIIDVMVFLGLIAIILFGFAIAFLVLFRHANNEEQEPTFFLDWNLSCVQSLDFSSASQLDVAQCLKPTDTMPTANLNRSDLILEAFCPSGGTDFGGFRNLPNSMMTMFLALLGDFDIAVFREHPHLAWLATVFFVLYMMAMMITMLNLLIGVMGDSFDRVRSEEEAQFLKGRASVIDDIEAGMSRKEIERLEDKIGKYLHALLPYDVPQELVKWTGKVTAVVDALEKTLDKNSKALQSRLESIDSSVTELKTTINDFKGRLNI